jgi:hypothetical protein
MATRVLAGDIFGLDKLVQWGTQIHSSLVGDYQEKSLCISQISEFAEQMGVRRKYRESIEQCIDEMLMNALYDAPVDDQGRQIFSEIPTKTRISLRVEQKVVVQYACDGKTFAVAVRDAFGTLERATVLRYLHKCLHNEQQIDRKAGGAGLGLYLMTNAASTVLFNVLPGVATEAVCTFDLETPKLSLQRFGYFQERIDAAGRLAAGPSRRLPVGVGYPVERRAPQPRPQPRGLVGFLVAMIAVIAVLIGIAAWPRLFAASKTTVVFNTIPKGATVEIEGKLAGTATEGVLDVPDLEVGRAYPVVAKLDGYEPRQSVVQPVKGKNEVTLELKALAATVTIDSQPQGATVESAGKRLGTTPLTTTALAPSSTVPLVFKKDGYKDAELRLDVPGPGKDTRVLQPLLVSDELARVRVTSEPPGAQIVRNGQLLAGVTTPAEILVEAGKPQRLVLTLPRHVPATIEPFTPERGADDIEKSAHLADGVTLSIESNLQATATVAGAPHCQALATPLACVLAPGTYTVEIVAAAAKATRKIAIAKADRKERFDFGTVVAAAGKQLQIGGVAVKRAVFEAGPRKLTVMDEEGTHTTTVVVKAGATVTAN